MAGISLKPPEPFDFEAPDDWRHWRGQLEQFEVASDLAEKDAKMQIQTLLYCIGEQSEGNSQNDQTIRGRLEGL